MAHVTDLGFTMDDLGDAIEAGDVRVQQHPEFPELLIFNYTEDVQYRNRWNAITLACRGLILNNRTGEVIARPWEKFFNFGQMDNRVDSNAPVEVTDKMDGSLGILWATDESSGIATRGSFASEQAIHATELFFEYYGDLIYWPATSEHTFLFEIVYPENRIVVDYDGMDDLVLLGAVNKKYGFYYGPLEAKSMLNWPGPVTEVFHADNFVASLSLPDRKGKEGYVIRSGRNIVKLKQADYVELHRIVTNLSPKTIWEMLQRGETVNSIAAPLPDEFHGYVEKIGGELNDRFFEIALTVTIEFSRIKSKLREGDGIEISRRAWAEEIKKSTYPGLMFMRLDGKDTTDAIWKLIKPRGDIKSLVEDEG